MFGDRFDIITGVNYLALILRDENPGRWIYQANKRTSETVRSHMTNKKTNDIE